MTNFGIHWMKVFLSIIFWAIASLSLFSVIGCIIQASESDSRMDERKAFKLAAFWTVALAASVVTALGIGGLR